VGGGRGGGGLRYRLCRNSLWKIERLSERGRNFGRTRGVMGGRGRSGIALVKLSKHTLKERERDQPLCIWTGGARASTREPALNRVGLRVDPIIGLTRGPRFAGLHKDSADARIGLTRITRVYPGGLT